MTNPIQQAIEDIAAFIDQPWSESQDLHRARAALASLRAAQEGGLPPLPDHWIPVTFVGLSPLAIARAHEYAEAYARTAIAAAGGGVPQANSIQRRAASLHIKTGMSWDEAEQLALSEAGIDDEAIDELIGECGYSGLESLLTTPDELRRFTRSVLVHQPLASSPQPEAAQPNLVDDEGVMNTPLLRAARLLVCGSHPSKDCAGPYMVPADLWLTLQAEVMESLRQAAARDLANPVQPEAAPAVAQVPPKANEYLDPNSNLSDEQLMRLEHRLLVAGQQGRLQWLGYWKPNENEPNPPESAWTTVLPCEARGMLQTHGVYRFRVKPAPNAPAQAEVDLTPTEFCWLVEHFIGDGTGNSTGHYHTGFTDIGGHSRTTRDPYRAKRYATWREANLAAMKLGHTLSGTWRAVQHGFAAPMPEAPAQADEGHVVVCWNHDRTRILAVTRQNTEGQILKVIAEAPAQAAPLAGEVERAAHELLRTLDHGAYPREDIDLDLVRLVCDAALNQRKDKP